MAHTCGGSDWWHQEENVVSLVAGDELRLKYAGDPLHAGWQSVGHVVRGRGVQGMEGEMMAFWIMHTYILMCTYV